MSEEAPTRIQVHPGKPITLCDIEGCIEISAAPATTASASDPFTINPGSTVFPAMIAISGHGQQHVVLRGPAALQDSFERIHVRSDDFDALARASGIERDDAALIDRSVPLAAHGEAVEAYCVGDRVELGGLIALHRATVAHGGEFVIRIVDPDALP